jgi:hypothetical protein
MRSRSVLCVGLSLALAFSTTSCASLLGIEEGIPENATGDAGQGTAGTSDETAGTGGLDPGGEGGTSSGSSGTGGTGGGNAGTGAGASGEAGQGGTDAGSSGIGGGGGNGDAGTGAAAGTGGAAGVGGAAGTGGAGGTGGGAGAAGSAGTGGAGGSGDAGTAGTGGTGGASGSSGSAGSAGAGGSPGVVCSDPLHCSNGTCDRPCVGGVLKDLVHVGAGKDFTCALDVDGGAWCWGNAATGLAFQPGSSGPIKVPYANGFDALARGASAEHMCGVVTAVLPTSCPGFQPTSAFFPNVGVVCWGAREGDPDAGFAWERFCSTAPKVGPASIYDPSEAYRYAPGSPLPRAPLPAVGLAATGYVRDAGSHPASWFNAGIEVVAVATTGQGPQRTRCFVKKTGTNGLELYCAGDNTHGLFADGTTTTPAIDDFDISKTAPFLGTATSGASSYRLSLAETHACLSSEKPGGVQCWGDNTSKRLNDSASSSLLTPTSIVGGDARLVGVSSTGYCYIGGPAAIPQLRCRSFPTLDSAPITEPLTGDVVDLSTGSAHVCVIRKDGRALCRGDNTQGQSAPGDSATIITGELREVRFPASG